MRALLALEDGTIFTGRAFGSPRASGGEVVFNTSMTGYQEILTDPSYYGQIVVFTAPQIGNYGIHRGHGESSTLRVAGVITREACAYPSHPDSRQSLPAFLREHQCFGLTEVDTRALTLLLRTKGSLRGWLTNEVTDPQEAVHRAREVPPMDQVPAVTSVTTAKTYTWEENRTPRGSRPSPIEDISAVREPQSLSRENGWIEREEPRCPADERQRPTEGEPALTPAYLADLSSGEPAEPLATRAAHNRPDAPRVVVFDCGVKYNILRELTQRGCLVTVVGAETPASAIERLSPDGIVLSNGPGDPTALRPWLPRISSLMERYPTLAICLGHQLAGLAIGCRIVKLPFGHHGGNHPVKDLRANRVHITAQNHNYAIDPQSVPRDLEITHLNLNDGTVEGIAHRSLPLWSVQYHPEAGPGPHEASATFDAFTAALFHGSRRSRPNGID